MNLHLILGTIVVTTGALSRLAAIEQNVASLIALQSQLVEIGKETVDSIRARTLLSNEEEYRAYIKIDRQVIDEGVLGLPKIQAHPTKKDLALYILSSYMTQDNHKLSEKEIVDQYGEIIPSKVANFIFSNGNSAAAFFQDLQKTIDDIWKFAQEKRPQKKNPQTPSTYKSSEELEGLMSKEKPTQKIVKSGTKTLIHRDTGTVVTAQEVEEFIEKILSDISTIKSVYGDDIKADNLTYKRTLMNGSAFNIPQEIASASATNYKDLAIYQEYTPTHQTYISRLKDTVEGLWKQIKEGS